ncbi:Rieske (2Fe-2S) protein [Streptomyces sp. AV19]|uniref:Rieske 2Fe-2S domain-containing protein n=1 Tax=Streptomyces sp. AV19 TaxID=2793068 RepID=UPI0018FF0257|nr:Rieske 2Fe-2S domain-containing protein [Streptomyces sp. AV19]MBH1934486.1 Rieske (2Fe-2S) protein [Streptomyces sp. AV19]MDG4533278.1 Rieske (2Fe-2S) protein [Streptomyces sp. AV19]
MTTGADLPGSRELPYPSSWFFLALSRELRPGRVLTRRLAGEDVVLYRTDDGRPYAVRPYCPHLGAHFGSGGTVAGRNLVCPFHHFAFAPDGTCVGTPDGPPPRARVEHHTIRERNGFVFVWYAPDGKPPAWDAPESAPAGVLATAAWSTEVRAHVQELAENTLDYRHVPVVHHVTLRELEPPRAEGPCLHTRLRLSPAGPAPLTRFRVDHSFTMSGLGCVRIEHPLPPLGLVIYLWALHTPTGRASTRLQLATACAEMRPSRAPGPRRPLHRALARLMLRIAVAKVQGDIRIWNTKRYEPRPRLTTGDEAIGLYRHWVRQFYPSP